MKKTLCLTVIFLGIYFSAKAQQQTEINWKTWEQLEDAFAKKAKPVFVFFQAEWCAYCKKIKREILTKEKVIKKLNADYYAVKMDVESTDTIYFDGVEFVNKQALTKRNGIHQLPLLLASREEKAFSLPATLFFDKNFRIKKRVFEYYTSKELLKLL